MKDIMWWIILILLVVLIVALVIAYMMNASTMWYLLIIGFFVLMMIIVMAWSFTMKPTPPVTTQTVYQEVPTHTEASTPTSHHVVTHIHHNADDVVTHPVVAQPMPTQGARNVRSSVRPATGATLDPDPVVNQVQIPGQSRRVRVNGPQGVQGATYTEPGRVISQVSDVPNTQVQVLRPGEIPPPGSIVYQVMG